MKIKAYVIGNVPEGAEAVMQYTITEAGTTPLTELVDETNTEFNLSLSDGVFTAKDTKFVSEFAMGRTIVYRFGIRVNEDIYWGAQKQFGPSEPAYELYHAVEIYAATNGKANLTLLHPLQSELNVAVRVNGGALQALTRDSMTKFKAENLNIPANSTFTYVILQNETENNEGNILYESLPFNVTTIATA